MSKIDSLNSKKTLFVDIGNSSIKVAFTEDGIWEKVNDSFKSVTYLISWLNSHLDSVEKLIIASVRKDHFLLLKNQVTDLKIVHISIQDIDFDRVSYTTLNTLGIDRYLVCLGAYHEVKKSVVVIDAGSACTIDMMDGKGIFQGGVIMPGLQSILNIFKSSAPELPEISPEIPKIWPGKSTAESLQWGQVSLFRDGMRSSLERYKEEFGEFSLFITGGDSKIVSNLISIPSKRDEFLIFKGMKAFIGG